MWRLLARARSRRAYSNISGVTTSVEATLKRLDGTMATVDRNVERTAETQYQTVRSIDELNELLRTVRLLVDTLQRHPEALLQGKPEPKKEND